MIIRRLFAMIPVLLIVSFGVFMLTALVPGDAAVTIAGGESATIEEIERIRDELGLDDPLLVQYGRWLADAVRLDFGTSLFSGQVTVWEEIQSRVPVTFGIALMALFFGLLVGIPVGIAAGMKPGRTVDRVSIAGTSLGLAIPNFFLAMLLIVFFAIQRSWFPALGYSRFSDGVVDWLKTVTLPALSLGLLSGASVARQLRAALIDTLNSNYVRTAWASGHGTLRVVGKYALKNASIPAVTVIGLQLTFLLGGSVIIEQIFSIPGLGAFMLRALTRSDIPVIQGVTVTFVITYVVLNLLVDISYGYLNPKVRVT